MKTQFFLNSITYKNSQLSPPIFLFHFPSFSRENQKFIHISHTKSLCIHRPTRFSSIKASDTSISADCGGWDDLLHADEFLNSGESTKLRDFLVSIGIDDKKHVFMFVLGIFCAFAIARVRISSIIAFPASVLIFAIGFSFGLFRGGSFNEATGNASKKKTKEENFRVYGEKLKSLVDFFDGFDVKISDLKIAIQRAIETKEIELVDLENYIGVVESIQESAMSSRNTLEATTDIVGNLSNVFPENSKSSGRKKKEIGEVGHEMLQFLVGLFGEKPVESKPAKGKDKDNVKQGAVQGISNDQTQGNKSVPATEEQILNNNKGNRPSMFTQGLPKKSDLDSE